MNISWVVQYREQIEGQKAEEVKLVKIEGVEEWKAKKILNKRKVRRVVKYLLWWKEFTTKYDTWKREKDLENIKEVVVEFKKRMDAEVKQ